MTPSLDLQACTLTAWQATPDMAVRVAICAGLVAVAGWASARGAFPGKRSFVGTVIAMAVWIGLSITEHAAVDAACKGTLGVLSWAATLAQPALLALFVHRYVNAEARAPSLRVWLLVGAPIVALVSIAWTNGAHGLFYGPGTALSPPIAGMPRLLYEHGPFFFAAISLGYFWLATAVVLTLRAWRRSAPSQRGQWIVFLAMIAVPLVANVAYLAFGVRLLGADPTSTGFAFSVAGFAWMISRNRMFVVVPMARERLFAELPDPVLVLDLDGRVMDANQAARRLVGAPVPIGAPLAKWPRLGVALELHQAAGVDGAALELADPRAFYDVQRRDLGTPGRPLGALLQLHDVTERELAHTAAVRTLAAREVELGHATALQDLLREQAMHDPLTGLLNRRALQERYGQDARLGQARAVALVLLDLDRFKRINDTYGHPVGDAVLRDFAVALRSGLRAGDAVFRMGGEEFAVLMPQTSAATAEQRLRELRDLVARWRLGGLGEPVTFSAGVAESHPARESLESLLAAADKALYRAKQSGRDRVEVATTAC